MVISSYIKKYIPNNIEDINLETNDINSLNFMISNKNIYNLIILGNSGVGKSCLANIIYKKYYSDISNIELINNNILNVNILIEDGISYYRNDVKNFCNTCSRIKNYKKILIIDYIDIISDQSQLIIKNYIEEYSNTVLFVLILQDINKINNSIINNCDIINIKNPDYNFLLKILVKINENEKLNIDETTFNDIIFESKYNIPCLINNLQKIHLSNNINEFIDINKYKTYIQYCKNIDYINSIDHILNIYDNGINLIDILCQLNEYLKLSNDIETDIKYNLIKITIKYINKCHNNNDDKTELIFITNNFITIFI
tara:strand:+ start:266 stop:1207 length:942 start_codon:yes stop_codon:yes gene_type:complete